MDVPAFPRIHQMPRRSSHHVQFHHVHINDALNVEFQRTQSHHSSPAIAATPQAFQDREVSPLSVSLPSNPPEYAGMVVSHTNFRRLELLLAFAGQATTEAVPRGPPRKQSKMVEWSLVNAKLYNVLQDTLAGELW